MRSTLIYISFLCFVASRGIVPWASEDPYITFYYVMNSLALATGFIALCSYVEGRTKIACEIFAGILIGETINQWRHDGSFGYEELAAYILSPIALYLGGKLLRKWKLLKAT